MKNFYFFLIIPLVLASCTDHANNSTSGESDNGPTILIQDAFQDQTSVALLDFQFPDMYVDPCLNTNSSEDNFCECHPEIFNGSLYNHSLIEFIY